MRHGKDRPYSATGGRKARRERALERLQKTKFTPKTMSNGKERNETNWTEKKANQIEIEPDDSPNPPDPIPVVPVLETAPVVLQTTPKKRSSKGKRLFVVVLLFSALGAGGWFAHSQGLLPF